MKDLSKATGHADPENTIIKELTAKDSRWDVVMFSPDVTINNDPINHNLHLYILLYG